MWPARSQRAVGESRYPTGRSTLALATLLLLSCNGGGGDDGDSTPGADDDTTEQPQGNPGDMCDDFPGQLVCDEDTQLTCNELGDVATTEVCDEGAEAGCIEGIGCALCQPGDLRCEGAEAQRCEGDGQSWSVTETCDGDDGLVCQDGVCVSLCSQAELERSTVGCRFFAVDLEQEPAWHPDLPFGIAVSNVHETLVARVLIERRSGATWSSVAEPDVEPLDLEVATFGDTQVYGTGIGEAAAYRITSTIPVIAYQFNPLDGVESTSSDASLLLPTSSWDDVYLVPGWGSEFGYSGVAVVAADNVQVTVTPSVDTEGGDGVPYGDAGTPLDTVGLGEGDVLQVDAWSLDDSLQGSWIEADGPVGVFTGNTCANVPQGDTWCDHIEEQVLGLQTWGTAVLAARLPPRVDPPEPVVWQLLAGDLPTTLTFEAAGEVTGLPPGLQAELAAGESVDLIVSGSTEHPGDFAVSGTEAFLATQFMTGSICCEDIGDPCMAQAVPTEQLRDRYVVLVPSTWERDTLTFTRPTNSTIDVDGVEATTLPGATLTPLGTAWEVIRVDVDDGVHVLEGEAPFSVLVAGFDAWDSYCYPGGLDQRIINDL